MGIKRLVNKVKTIHVNYDVLVAAILHLQPEEQAKVNKRVYDVLKLSADSGTPDIKRKRQKMIDDVDDYDVILDVFSMLKEVTETLEHTLELNGGCGVSAYETIANAQMLIASIEDDEK